MTTNPTTKPPPTPAVPPAKPAWLPPHVPFGGDWDTFVRALYAIFEHDFKHTCPHFRASPVWHDRRVEADDTYGYEEGFWHMVSKDEWVWNTTLRKNEKTRLPEFDRAGRLPWAKPLIEHETAVEVLAWDFEQETRTGSAVRTYVWLKAHDYVVILERQQKQRGAVFMLITSFYVTFEGKRRDLQSRYERRRK